MKRINLIISILALASFIGCEREQQSDDSTGSGNVNSLSFFATPHPSTRAIVSNVFEGDWVWSSYDNLAVYSYNAQNYVNGEVCTINPDDIEFIEGTFNSSSDVDKWFVSSEKAAFYSYYPQSGESVPAPEGGKVSLTVPATQTGEWGQYQISWAKTAELDKAAVKENEKVALDFDAKTSILRTRLTLEEVCEVDELNVVKLTITLPEGVKAVGDCTLDLFTGAVTVAANGSSVITIDLGDNPVTAYKIKDANPTIDCAIFPVSLNAGTVTFDIETEDDGIVQVKKEITHDFVAGEPYDVDLNFTLFVDTTPHNYYYGSTNCYVVMGNSVTVDVTRHEADENYLPNDVEVTTSKDARSAVLLWREKTLTSINVPETVSGNSFEITNIAGNGNALVGIKDKRGNIIWSYHIWVPEIDPTAEANLLTYNNCTAEKASYQAMPLNLGATNVYVYSAEDDQTSAAVLRARAKSIGYYYQWGRKDPLGRIQASAYVAKDTPNPGDPEFHSGDFVESVDGENVAFKYTTAKVSAALAGATEDKGRVMREWSVKNPTVVLYAESAENQNWACENDNKLWGTTKTIYDPCPAGYIVAPNGFWSIFADSNNTATGKKNTANIYTNDKKTDKGCAFYYSAIGSGPTDFYTTSGRGQVNGSGVYAPNKPDEQCYYWSSTGNTDKQAYGLYLGTGSVGPSNKFDRENANTVRCVKIQ